MRKLTYAIPLFLAVALVLMSQSTGPPIGFTPVGTSPAGNACSNTSVNLLTPTGVIYTCVSGVYAVAPNGPPGGAAGGDLSGTYPNPTLAEINGVSVTGPAVATTLQGTIAVTTPASDVLCAHAGDTSNSLTCNNGATDDTTAYQYFATTYTIPASLWAQGRVLQVCAQFGFYSTSTAPTIQIVLAYGVSNNLLFSMLTNAAPRAGASNIGHEVCWQMIAASATSVFTQMSAPLPSTSALTATAANNTAQPVSIGASSQSLQIGWQWSTNTGLKTATYSSGGTFSGTGNCTLGTFNNGGSAATATIAVASGTPGAITVTNTGYGFTSAPTSATLASGTATCSGTPTLTSTLGGAQGNQMVLQDLTVSILH